MVLLPEILGAFNTLGISPGTSQDIAKSTYKKLALHHHPDRNHGDSSATQRFQQIGAAWQICQKHYEHPEWSQVHEGRANRPHERYEGRQYSKNEEVPLDDEESEEFFRFMFEEMVFDRFSYAKAQRYRQQRSGAGGGGVHTFSGNFADSQLRQEENRERQMKENEAYQQRVRELDLEIAAENRERERIAREQAKSKDRQASARRNAFSVGRAGDAVAMRAVIEEFDLDVKAPEILTPNQKQREESQRFETMLHVAAAWCTSEDLLVFLIRRGAEPTALNRSRLTPFHVSILRGNVSIVRWFLERQQAKPIEGCHPSKVAADGRTPLQLAIASAVPEVVQLLLKDATVHDVTRCWEQGEMQIWPVKQGETVELNSGTWESIKHVLATKKGFLQPVEPVTIEVDEHGHTLSKKAIRKRALAREAAAKSEEKVRRKAEETERAAEKQRKKRERAERQVKEETREREAEQLAQGAVRRAEAEAGQRRRDAENEACRLAEQEAQRKVEHVRREAEAEQERQRQASEMKRKQKGAAEAKLSKGKVRLEAEEEVRVKVKQEERVKIEQAVARRAVHEAATKRAKQQVATKCIGEQLNVEQEPTRLHEDARAVREMATARRGEAKARRRAEQSARDKARNQRIREEKERVKMPQDSVLTPSPTIRDHGQAPPPYPKRDRSQFSAFQPSTGASNHQRGRRRAHHSDHNPLPSAASPVPLHTRSKSAVPASLRLHTRAPPSPPMTPEDLQTCAIADGIFLHETPVGLTRGEVLSPKKSYLSMRGLRSQNNPFPGRGRGQASRGPARGRGRGRGEGVRGRGTRIHGASLEEGLVKKSREVERLRGQPPAAQASIPHADPLRG